MSLKTTSQKSIQQALSNVSFVAFAKSGNVPFPIIENEEYSFKNVTEEVGFIMAHKGFITGHTFSTKKPQKLTDMNISEDFYNVKLATENLFFMSEVRKQSIPMPNANFADYSLMEFSHKIDQVAFIMFYIGWRSALNDHILCLQKPANESKEAIAA